MEKFEYVHSLKNIPVPTNELYMKQLIAKTEQFIQRIRWKAYFHLNPSNAPAPNNTYGFKTTKTAPQVKELHDFENDLCEMVNNVEFTNSRSHFQRKLIKDAKDIRNSKDIYLLADKTRNIYQVSEDSYNKLLLDNVTSKYKKSSQETIDDVNTEARNIAARLGIEDRVECLAEKTAFITLKDHKPDFQNNPKCRLINPAKSQIGRISKQILDPINRAIRDKLGLNQWKSTQHVLDWFNKIEQKNEKKFMQFDICEFYPSITEELLNKALNFAHDLEPIAKDDIDVILHSRKSLLFTHSFDPNQQQTCPWTKKSGLFDVTMGACDGAEICELVGLYLLSHIKNLISELERELDMNLEIDLGLYRDDGLIVHKALPGPTTERIKKRLVSLFKEQGLAIEATAGMDRVDFLDVTLDLTQGKFMPYRKPNDQPLYVHRDSNHPPPHSPQTNPHLHKQKAL